MNRRPRHWYFVYWTGKRWEIMCDAWTRQPLTAVYSRKKDAHEWAEANSLYRNMHIQAVEMKIPNDYDPTYEGE